MMPDLRKILRLDMALIILLAAVVAMGLFLLQENDGLQQERARLETALRVSEIRITMGEHDTERFKAEIRENLELLEEPDPGQKEALMEALRRRLEQALDVTNPFPSRAEVVGVTDQIVRYVRQNNLIITRWTSGDTSTLLEERVYPAISHSIDVEGHVDALIGFIEDLIQAPVAPVIRGMDIRPHEEKEEVWRLRLEMIVHYL